MDRETSCEIVSDTGQIVAQDTIQKEPSPAILDRLRDSEFYRYYEPFRAAVASDRRRQRDGVLRSSDDRALTAFAQLGAIRLGARRCAISFFDRNTQYVLAEATKTLSLQTDEPEDPLDGLLWGVSEFPLDAGLCQYTLRLPMEFVEMDDGHRTEVAVNCFPDMKLDPRFRDLPFVCGEPATRFYAAVPIRSPSGVPLGSYCIMGDEPKPGLTPSEISFLKDMATTVMVHLEMVRAREEIRRNALVIQGLGSFVEGESTIWQGRRAAHDSSGSDLEDPGQNWHEQQYAMQQSSTAQRSKASSKANPELNTPHDDETTRDYGVDRPSFAAKHDPDDDKPEKASTDLSSHGPRAITQTSNLQDQMQGLDILHTFARAANIIRECTNLDGVVIYDASIRTFGGMVETLSETEQTTSSDGNRRASIPTAMTGGSPDTAVESQSKSENEGSTKHCSMLAFATPQHSTLQKDKAPESFANMTERLLRRLLKRYPLGRVFNLGSPGTSPLRSDEEGDWRNAGHKDRDARKGKRLHRSEIKILRHIFPGVRSIMLVPFYDINRKCNYAGGFVWSTDAQRVFSQEQALTYLAAFADSVMADVARIEARVAEKTKADFISSISHELRSPLHGILGGVECLQDAEDRALRTEMLHTVEICARTLLDTIDHLLEFAKINNFSKAGDSSVRSSARKIKRLEKIANDKGARAQMKALPTRRRSDGLETNVNIATITEEAIKTVQAGHAYSSAGTHTRKARDNAARHEPIASGQLLSDTSTSRQGHSEVSVIVNIDQSPEAEWLYRTQAGAWRRIVMNLFGNSLKYTAAGQICVSLRSTLLSAGDHGEIVLTVSDTGCGMSKEFQENHLFRPFAQEDYLAVGTGLGLSIIKQIVGDMGGKIAVHSEKGKGTIVEVKVVMARSTRAHIDHEHDIFQLEKAIITPDLTATGFNFSPITDNSNSQQDPHSTSESAKTDLEQRTLHLNLDSSASNSIAQCQDPKPKRVLLVEDNEVNLRLLIMYMEKQGHSFETARNGQEALDAFRAETAKNQPPQSSQDGHPDAHARTFKAFDYVLMDISMPVMDGLESTRCIRGHERELVAAGRAHGVASYTPATIIALTGLASTQTRQEAYSSGVDHFMPKPVKLAELTKVMAADDET